MGFTLMALEVLLLLGFQAIYGYVYQQLALLVAAVMMGMALGSWLGLRSIGRRDASHGASLRVLATVQVIAALSPLFLYGFFLICARSNSPAGLFLVGRDSFPRRRVLCGMLGGYQFPLASNLFFAGRKDAPPQNTGSLYAVDLLGACIGAVILSAYLVPVFGFLKAATLILVLNLATALLAFIGRFTGEDTSGVMLSSGLPSLNTSAENRKMSVSSSFHAEGGRPAFLAVSSRKVLRSHPASTGTCGSSTPSWSPFFMRRPCWPTCISLTSSTRRKGDRTETS